MKKITLLTLLILSFTACKKDDSPEPQPIDNPAPNPAPNIKEQIIGFWWGNGSVTNTYHDDELFNTKVEPDQDATFEFFDDNTYVSKAPSFADYNGVWGYDEANKEFTFETYPFDIITLNDKEFIFTNISNKQVGQVKVTTEVIVKLIKK